MCRITHLNYPQGASINSFIDPEDCKTNYQTLDMALKCKCGKGCFMAKEDFKSAFCNVPMCFNDLLLLGIKVQGQFFIDCCLSFGAAVSCQVFEKIAMLIHWIAQKRAGYAFVHYLDDFFMVDKLSHTCSYIMGMFKQVCHEVGMPISPDKSVGPVQVIEFLDLTIDSVFMVVQVPQDKLQDISITLITMIKKWKATGYELESLAAKLNFILRIIPAGRSFSQRIYQAQIGIKKKLHIDLKVLVLQDIHMWRTFLSKFRGWNPIVDIKHLSHHPVEVVAGAAGSAQWAGVFGCPIPVTGCMVNGSLR